MVIKTIQTSWNSPTRMRRLFRVVTDFPLLRQYAAVVGSGLNETLCITGPQRAIWDEDDQGNCKDRALQATVHTSRVDLCAVYTSLVQCVGSSKHAGGRKISYWSEIRRRSEAQRRTHNGPIHVCLSVSLYVAFSLGGSQLAWTGSLLHNTGNLLIFLILLLYCYFNWNYSYCHCCSYCYCYSTALYSPARTSLCLYHFRLNHQGLRRTGTAPEELPHPRG
jgi:hypothetical protein